MTDKEIMIDGVDVSGCVSYFPKLGKCDCIALGNNSSSTCNGSPNCYYKQLQREKQNLKLKHKSIEALKKAVLLKENNRYVLSCLLKQEKQKNEELENKINRKKSSIECAVCPSYGYCEGDKTEPRCTRKYCFDVGSCDWKEKEEYKQALKEIGEIAYSGFNNSQCNCGAKVDLDKILQKVKEVIE